MFKVFAKLLILILVFLGIGLFFSSSSTVSADVNCPQGDVAPGNWGTNAQDGPFDHGFAAVAVHAYYKNNFGEFVPLDVQYHLNSSLDHAGNPNYDIPGDVGNPDARIFNEPIPGGGRYSERWFGTGGTGDQLYAGSQSHSTCPGWDELGVGTPNAIGNRYLLDCQEYDTKGNAHSNHFWIDQIKTPDGPIGHQYGGQWKVEVSTGGTSFTSYPFPMSASDFFTVINGNNARVNLEWVPNPPPPPKTTQNCTTASIRDDGGYNGNDTKTIVVISGTTADQTKPIDYGQTGTFNYTAISGNITIRRIRQENKGSPSNPNWQSYSDTTQTIECYHASCYPQDVIDSSGRSIYNQGGFVQAGQPFTVRLKFWNDNLSSDAETIPANVGGYLFSMSELAENGHDSSNPNSPYNSPDYIRNPVGYSVNPSTAAEDVHVVDIPEPPQPAPAGRTLYTMNFYPAMDNGDESAATRAAGNGELPRPLSNDGNGKTVTCAVSVPIYQHFSATPTGSPVTLLPDNEDPSQATYSTRVDVSPSSAPVTIPTTSYFKKLGGSNIASNNGGIYPPSTALSGTYNIPPGFQAGDQYCSHIDAAYTDGYVGPGGSGDVIGTSGPASWDSCDKITNKPYFKAYGSSVTAGAAIRKTDGTCSPGNGGLLAGWNDNTNSTDRGAGSQLSALALVKITGFASAQTDITRSPTDLTFANNGTGVSTSTNTDSPDLGGNFNGSGFCIDDVVQPKSGNTQTLPGGSTYGGAANITNDRSVFVNGDAYITGNVTYGSFGSVDNAPSFVLHATGNIYIDPSVTELDGLYESNKNIYTCADSSGPIKSNEFATCHNQLLVYGGFAADQVKLGRTFGSLRDEKPLGAQPVGSQIGVQWSSCGTFGKPVNGESCLASQAQKNSMNCANTTEPADSLGWNDNYICAPKSSNLQLSWYSAGKQALSLPYCTQWKPASSPTNGWNDNWLCMNQARSDGSPLLQFSINNDPNQYCTKIFELADNTNGWDNGHYLCEPKASPGNPGGAPATPACSNKGTQVVASTCAAEVFRFSPELYLSSPAIQQTNYGAPQWDAVTGLPPVL